MSPKRASDWMLTLSVGGGLVFPPALGGILLAILLRGNVFIVRWRIHHTFICLAALWGVVVMFQRSSSLAPGTAMYFAYLWLLPILIAIYKPDTQSLRAYAWLIVLLFALDLLFNTYSVFYGQDLLGRTLDPREGLIGGRNGGLFAHSFYSGSISIAALIIFLASTQSIAFTGLAILNLIAAGSWRLAIATAVILSLTFVWRQWSRAAYGVFIGCISLVVVVGIVVTSGLYETPLDDKLSNANRLFAWLLAVDKIFQSPLFGVGFPSTSSLDAVTFEVIDDNLIAESWYLGTSLTFGIPYTVFTLLALVCAFFGQNFTRRDKVLSMLMPLIFVDLVSGEFFSGVLIYTWLWLLIGRADRGTQNYEHQLLHLPGHRAGLSLHTLGKKS